MATATGPPPLEIMDIVGDVDDDNIANNIANNIADNKMREKYLEDQKKMDEEYIHIGVLTKGAEFKIPGVRLAINGDDQCYTDDGNDDEMDTGGFDDIGWIEDEKPLGKPPGKPPSPPPRGDHTGMDMEAGGSPSRSPRLIKGQKGGWRWGNVEYAAAASKNDQFVLNTKYLDLYGPQIIGYTRYKHIRDCSLRSINKMDNNHLDDDRLTALNVLQKDGHKFCPNGGYYYDSKTSHFLYYTIYCVLCNVFTPDIEQLQFFLNAAVTESVSFPSIKAYLNQVNSDTENYRSQIDKPKLPGWKSTEFTPEVYSGKINKALLNQREMSIRQYEILGQLGLLSVMPKPKKSAQGPKKSAQGPTLTPKGRGLIESFKNVETLLSIPSHERIDHLSSAIRRSALSSTRPSIRGKNIAIPSQGTATEQTGWVMAGIQRTITGVFVELWKNHEKTVDFRSYYTNIQGWQPSVDSKRRQQLPWDEYFTQCQDIGDGGPGLAGIHLELSWPYEDNGKIKTDINELLGSTGVLWLQSTVAIDYTGNLVIYSPAKKDMRDPAGKIITERCIPQEGDHRGYDTFGFCVSHQDPNYRPVIALASGFIRQQYDNILGIDKSLKFNDIDLWKEILGSQLEPFFRPVNSTGKVKFKTPFYFKGNGLNLVGNLSRETEATLSQKLGKGILNVGEHELERADLFKIIHDDILIIYSDFLNYIDGFIKMDKFYGADGSYEIWESNITLITFFAALLHSHGDLKNYTLNNKYKLTVDKDGITCNSAVVKLVLAAIIHDRLNKQLRLRYGKNNCHLLSLDPYNVKEVKAGTDTNYKFFVSPTSAGHFELLGVSVSKQHSTQSAYGPLQGDIWNSHWGHIMLFFGGTVAVDNTIILVAVGHRIMLGLLSYISSVLNACDENKWIIHDKKKDDYGLLYSMHGFHCQFGMLTKDRSSRARSSPLPRTFSEIFKSKLTVINIYGTNISSDNYDNLYNFLVASNIYYILAVKHYELNKNFSMSEDPHGNLKKIGASITSGPTLNKGKQVSHEIDAFVAFISNEDKLVKKLKDENYRCPVTLGEKKLKPIFDSLINEQLPIPLVCLSIFYLLNDKFIDLYNDLMKDPTQKDLLYAVEQMLRVTAAQVPTPRLSGAVRKALSNMSCVKLNDTMLEEGVNVMNLSKCLFESFYGHVCNTRPDLNLTEHSQNTQVHLDEFVLSLLVSEKNGPKVSNQIALIKEGNDFYIDDNEQHLVSVISTLFPDVVDKIVSGELKDTDVVLKFDGVISRVVIPSMEDIKIRADEIKKEFNKSTTKRKHDETKAPGDTLVITSSKKQAFETSNKLDLQEAIDNKDIKEVVEILKLIAWNRTEFKNSKPKYRNIRDRINKAKTMTELIEIKDEIGLSAEEEAMLAAGGSRKTRKRKNKRKSPKTLKKRRKQVKTIKRKNKRRKSVLKKKSILKKKPSQKFKRTHKRIRKKRSKRSKK